MVFLSKNNVELRKKQVFTTDRQKYYTTVAIDDLSVSIKKITENYRFKLNNKR